MTDLPAAFAASGIHVRAGAVPPTRFQVLGERSSGTNYVKRLLGRNSPLTPTEALGWKHGPLQTLAIPADLLVIVVVRNAADWARSMHAKPWHATPALQALEMGDFLRAPWDSVIDRPRYFENVTGDIPGGAKGLVGQPLQADRDPVSGRRFANLIALRRGKLTQHLSLLGRDCACALVRLEAAQEDPAALVDQILAGLDLPARDAPLKPVVKRLGSRFKPAIEARPDTPPALDADDLAFLRAEVDAQQEAALGYTY
ncbi:MAG: hypothetical protein ACWA5A_03705 [Marinibacterium sp.]